MPPQFLLFRSYGFVQLGVSPYPCTNRPWRPCRRKSLTGGGTYGLAWLAVCSPWLRCDQTDSRSILLLLPCLALPQHELSPPPRPKTVSTDKPFSVLSGLGHSNSKVTNAKGNRLPQQFRLFRVTSSRCFQDAFRVHFSPASLPGSSKPPRLSGLFYRSLTDF